MKHMNVMWYAGKFDEACWQLLSMLGLTPSRFAQGGTGMAAVEQHIQYKRELHAGDAITIQSALLEVKDKSIHMLHKMIDDATGGLLRRRWSLASTWTRSSGRRSGFLRMCANEL
jgi:acyl-CoA thioester hydrolase